MHICLDFIPQMLASSELETQVRRTDRRLMEWFFLLFSLASDVRLRVTDGSVIILSDTISSACGETRSTSLRYLAAR